MPGAERRVRAKSERWLRGGCESLGTNAFPVRGTLRRGRVKSGSEGQRTDRPLYADATQTVLVADVARAARPLQDDSDS